MIERFVARPRLAAALLVLVAILVGCALTARPPMGSDARYTQSAREMLVTGDWLVPTLGWVPYVEKPPLTVWASAVCQQLAGRPVAGSHWQWIVAQFPAALSSGLLVLATWLWAVAWRGPRFALGAAGLVAGSALGLAGAGVMTTDPLLAAAVAFALVGFFRGAVAPGARARWWLWGAWAALGVGALAKGPIALVLPGLGIAAWIALVHPPRAWLAAVCRLRPLTGLAIVAALNVPYWAAVWARDPRYVEFFFLYINLRGAADIHVNHPGPPWMYLGVFAWGSVPWTWLAAGGVALAVTSLGRALRRQAVDPGTLFAACVLVAPLLFLSVVASKLPMYVLPLLPALALLTAAWLAPQLAAPPRWLRLAPLVQLAGLLVAAVVAVVVVDRSRLESQLALHALSGIAGGLALGIIGLAWGAVAAWRGRLVASAAAGAVGLLAGAAVIGPQVDDLMPYRNVGVLAERWAPRIGAGERVVVTIGKVQDYRIHLALGERRMAIAGNAREQTLGHFVEVVPRTRPLPRTPREWDAIDAVTLPGNRWLLSIDALAAGWGRGPRLWLFTDAAGIDELDRRGIEPVVLETARKGLLVTDRAWP